MKFSSLVLPVVVSLTAPLAFSAPTASRPFAKTRVVAQAHDPSGTAAAMHGAAPQPAGPAKLAEVTLAPGLKDKAVESFFRGLAEAIKTRDGKPLLPRLADTYTIEGLPPEWEIKESFVKAIGMIPGPDEMAVMAIKRDGDTKVVKAELRYAARVATKTFTFDAQDKLLGTDFISMKRAPAPAPPAPKSDAKK